MEQKSENKNHLHSTRNFLFFWSGQQISLLGSFIAQFVIIWWITITYNSAFYLSLAAFLGFGSILLSSLVAGVYIDRHNRKLIILLADSLQAILSLIMVYLFYISQMTLTFLLILLALRGIFQGIQQPAVWAVVPILVPQELLTRINALDYLLTGVISLVGPLIAAILLSIFGLDNIESILLVDVVSYVVSFVPLVLINIPNVRQKPSSSYFSEFREGIDFIKNTRGLTVLMMIFPFANFFLSPFITLLPILVVNPNIFDGNEIVLAQALAIQQVAFIIGSILMSKFVLFRKNTTGVAFGIYLWILGIVIAVIAGFIHSIPILYLGLFISGFTIPITNVSSQTIWQTVVPLDLQGRVNVVRRLFGEGSTPIALILAGIIAELINPLILLLIGAFLELVILTYIYKFTAFGEVETILAVSSESREPTKTAESGGQTGLEKPEESTVASSSIQSTRV